MAGSSTGSTIEFDANTTSTTAISCCIVCDIKRNVFSTYSYAQKTDIIEKGRVKPSLKNVSTKMKSFTRHFNTEMYDSVEWLTGCETLGKLYCWPCLLFSTENTVWNKAGVCDMNNIHKGVKRHSTTKNHLECIWKLKTFNKFQRIDHTVDSQLKISHQKHNETVRKNREIVKRLIDVVCFLGFHELSFRGHNESSSSVNKGNYKDLLDLIAKYDPILENHLENHKSFEGTSNLIQNDLISSVANVALESIKKEVLDTKFVAIILDETTDVSNTSQLATVIRYVTNEGKVEERFLGFQNVSSDRTAEALYKIVCETVEEFKCGTKLVAQSYDGAAVMSGHLGGLQSKVKETFPNAIFVHCFAHRLNLVLSQSASRIKECKLFFMTLNGIASFFSQSSKRTHALDEEVKKRLSKVSQIRWNYSSRLVRTVSEFRESLIDLFENIIENDDGIWDAETMNQSRGYVEVLKRDFTFNFLLNIFGEIFPLTDSLFDILQSKSNDIGYCVKKINEFIGLIKSKRENFENFWEKTTTTNDISEPKRKRMRIDENCDLKTCYRRLFFEIIDNIVEQLNSRFNNFECLKFLELANFQKHSSATLFPQIAFDSLLQNYGNYFDVPAFRSELSVIYSTTEGVDKSSASDLLNCIKKHQLDMAYSEVLKFCELVLTIPATSSSAERSFSALKRIKTYLRNSTNQERMSNLAILSIEKALIKELTCRTQFYDAVIDDFASKERRIALHYK